MSTSQRWYLPAAGRDWALPLYDPLTKLLGAGAARRALLDQVNFPAAGRILDLGCGTGTLVVRIKQLHPTLDVVGLDPDPKALARARRKASRAAVTIQLDQGFSDDLPYPDASFDRVLSSFMLHHLRADEKEQTMREVRRILTPDGFFHLLDFGEAKPGQDGFLAHLMHTHSRMKNSEDRIISLMREAGLAEPREVESRTMLLGRVAFFQAGTRCTGP